MNKNEFIYNLKLNLEKAYKNIDKHEINEIIRDYEEYFMEGINEGKSEKELVSSLGEPRKIVDEMIRNDIDNGKYVESDFIDFQGIYTNYNEDISNVTRKTDAHDAIVNNAYNEIDKDTKITYKNEKIENANVLSIHYNLFRFIRTITLALFDIIYFPVIVAIVFSFVGLGIFGLLLIPYFIATYDIIGQSSFGIVFPIISAISFIVLVAIAGFNLLKLGIFINKKALNIAAKNRK